MNRKYIAGLYLADTASQLKGRQWTTSSVAVSVVVTVAVATLTLLSFVNGALAETDQESALALGKEITFDRVKGNCLACHMIDDGELPGTIAPPLIAMPQRFPDKDVLRAKIWDPTTSNPESIMPPYGRHKILTEQEIDLVVAYLYSL